MPLPAFVINLDRSPSRLASVTAELGRAGVAFTRFAATDGALADRGGAEVSPWGRHFATDSMLGCALSHVRLWRHVRDAGLPAALIMEDDVLLAPRFATRLRAVLRQVPADYDVLLLGYFELGAAALAGVVRSLTGRRPGPVSDRVCTPVWPAGFHCYVVSAQGARKLASARAAFHIDVQVSAMRGLNLYAATPPLASQADMTASTMASFDFPRSVNRALAGVRTGHGISLAYYVNVPWAQVGGVQVTAWLLAFLAMGLARARPGWVTAFLLAEAALGGPSNALRDCAAAYSLGYLFKRC